MSARISAMAKGCGSVVTTARSHTRPSSLCRNASGWIYAGWTTCRPTTKTSTSSVSLHPARPVPMQVDLSQGVRDDNCVVRQPS